MEILYTINPALEIFLNIFFLIALVAVVITVGVFAIKLFETKKGKILGVIGIFICCAILTFGVTMESMYRYKNPKTYVKFNESASFSSIYEKYDILSEKGNGVYLIQRKR